MNGRSSWPASRPTAAQAPAWTRKRVLFGTARLWDDGIIDPRETRRILGLCLAMARDARAAPAPNTFGVARLYANPTDFNPGSHHAIHPEHEQIRDTGAQIRRQRNQPFTRRGGKRPASSAHAAVQKMGDLGLLGIKVPTEIRRHGAGLQLLHGHGRGAGRLQRGRRAHGHRRADRHVHPGAGALWQRRAAP